MGIILKELVFQDTDLPSQSLEEYINIEEIDIIKMDLNTRKFHIDEQKIHSSNFNLYRSRKTGGMIGAKHSELINKLTNILKDQHQKENNRHTMNIQSEPSLKDLLYQITQLEREGSNLKKDILRISQLSKINKNSKIAIELKYEQLLNQHKRSQSQAQELSEKVKALTELNLCLFKIIDKFLHVFPSYQNSFDGLIQFINVINNQIVSQSKKQSTMGSSLQELQNRLHSFKGTVDNMQSFQKKLLNNLAEAQMRTKTISQKISIMSHLNQDELKMFRKQLSDISQLIMLQTQDPFVQHQKQVSLYSQVCGYTFFPQHSSSLSKTFKQIMMVFERHIHMLQNQKMQYQFTKNKKLIDCQKFECQICQSYQKIVYQIFSTVRQAFKQIKSQFMKLTKEITDSLDIPFLI